MSKELIERLKNEGDGVMSRREKTMLANRIEELEREVASRDAEVAELKADAMRYRWLCHRDATKDIAICEWVAEEGDWYAIGMSKQPVDAIIDREIAKVRKP